MAREVYNVTAEFSFTGPEFKYKSPADIARRYNDSKRRKEMAAAIAKFLDENFPIDDLTPESAVGIASDVSVRIEVTFEDDKEQAAYHFDCKHEQDLEIAKMTRVEDLGKSIGIKHTVWSMGEKETNALLANALFASGTVTIQYSHSAEYYVNLLSPTYQDLWRAADRLCERSGDNHHVYLEAAKRVGNNNIYELWFGS